MRKKFYIIKATGEVFSVSASENSSDTDDYEQSVEIKRFQPGNSIDESMPPCVKVNGFFHQGTSNTSYSEASSKIRSNFEEVYAEVC